MQILRIKKAAAYMGAAALFKENVIIFEQSHT